MQMSVHRIFKCRHGVIVRQCRCPEPTKRVIIVPCPPECEAKDDEAA